jgi:hypothetical protein
MRLKRTGTPGFWKSRDDRWTFILQKESGKWEIYLHDEFPECNHGFGTLQEAASHAQKLDEAAGKGKSKP